eukprot:9194566-Heterocapsa_arctica.AAC.1
MVDHASKRHMARRAVGYAYEQCCAPANLWQNKGKKQILVSFRGKHRTREANLRLRPECEQHGIGQKLQESVKYLGGRVDAEKFCAKRGHRET